MTAEEQAELEAERATRALLVRRLDQIARGDEILIDGDFAPVVQEPPVVKRGSRRRSSS